MMRRHTSVYKGSWDGYNTTVFAFFFFRLRVEPDRADDIGQSVTVACHPSHRKVPRRAESYSSKSGKREPKASRRGYHTSIQRGTITQARIKD